MPSEVSILRKELHNVHKELHNVRKENMQLREAFKTIYEESSKAITCQTKKYHMEHQRAQRQQTYIAGLEKKYAIKNSRNDKQYSFVYICTFPNSNSQMRCHLIPLRTTE